MRPCEIDDLAVSSRQTYGLTKSILTEQFEEREIKINNLDLSILKILISNDPKRVKG